MIFNFTNRQCKPLAIARTDAPGGLAIYDDLFTDTLETGTSNLTATIIYSIEDYSLVKSAIKPANYIICWRNNALRCYTIMRTEDDRLTRTIHFEAEDVGLELLNDVAIKYPDNLQNTPAMTMTEFVNMWISGTGFRISENAARDDTRKKNPQAVSDSDGVREAMDNEATVTARLKAVADLFGYELGYHFAENQFKVADKCVDIYKKRGETKETKLYINKQINNIRITQNTDNLCTSLLCYGATVGSQPIMLDGMTYDDGEDFKIGWQWFADRRAKHACLQSRKALAVYGLQPDATYHHLTGVFHCEAQTQVRLRDEAIKELKKRCKPEVQYEVEIVYSDDDINLGDYINIIDEQGQMYIKARVQKIEESVTNKTKTFTLGDYEELTA